jgi:putative FmdB family regulatory protein
MPIYEYVCSACAHRADILHGRSEPGPNFCLECGAEGTMRKAFAPPTIVFKGSGWAKKDRRSGSTTKAASEATSGGDGSKDSGSGADASADKAASKPAEPATSASSDTD